MEDGAEGVEGEETDALAGKAEGGHGISTKYSVYCNIAKS